MKFKNIHPNLLFILLHLCLFNKAYSQETVFPELKINHEIEGMLTNFIKEIPAHLLKNYGIDNPSELNRLRFTNPVLVYTLQDDSLSPTNTWRIPLIIDNNYKALFTIYKDANNKYKVADFGATILADELNISIDGKPVSAMLRVYELKKDFIIYGNKIDGFRFKPIPDSDAKQYQLIDIIEMKNKK